MENCSESKLLRIFLSNTDKFKHNLAYEMIIYAAKKYGIAGATVTKGIMGYGTGSKVYSSKFWEFSEKIPVIIEIIDESNKIDGFIEFILPWFDKFESGCMITVERANIVLYKKNTKNKTNKKN